MAGLTPGKFVTGANAVIIVNGNTVGYATDVQYTIQVKHAAPHILGVYETPEIAPLSIITSGSFTVIRYHKHINEEMEENDVNGVGDFGLNDILSAVGVPLGKYAQDGRPQDSFNPQMMNKSMMFDIEVRNKSADGECTVDLIKNCRLIETSVRITKKGLKLQTYSFKAIYAEDDTFTAFPSGQGQLNQ